VVFDPSQVSYASLIEFFYRMHDPTTLNRQGMDTGSQYRSAIFYHSPEQRDIATSVTQKVQSQWYKDKPITTVITEAREWWDAEAYHQRYLENNPGGYECPAHHVRNFPPLSRE
jgi:peptide-methionine (S)-S-oxide reductase